MNRMKHVLRFSALAGMVFLSACSSIIVPRPLPPPPAPLPAPAWAPASALPANDTESLLWYCQWVQTMPPAQLAREQDTARRALHGANSDFERLRLACALSVTAQGDDWLRVLELTDAVVKNTASPLRPLAAVLQSQFAERRRLEAGAAGLQEKLDALKSLEKSMNERGKR